MSGFGRSGALQEPKAQVLTVPVLWAEGPAAFGPPTACGEGRAGWGAHSSPRRPC